MALAAPGVGSNLDVNTIVSQLMTLERRPLTLLDSKEAGYQAKLSAYGSLRGALSSLQSAISQLDSLSRFESLTVASSDAAVASGTAGATALVGSYSLEVTQLARSQSLLAAGQSSLTATIGGGASTTITFSFGTISGGTLSNGIYTGATFTQDGGQPSGTVTIDSSNNTLQGIRDAINAANVGVRASIVKDGSSAPYRLVLQSGSSGLARSMRISVSGDASLQGLLEYDAGGTQNLTQSEAASDAKLSVNGVSITSSSNLVSDALEGVTLTLGKTGGATLSVTRDTNGVAKSVEAFVKAYNELNSIIENLMRFDAQTGQGGPLIGDTAARTIQNDLRNALASAIGGISDTGLRVLSQAGVSFQRDGSLMLDSAKLRTALTERFDDVARLFASVGRTSDSLVEVVGSGDKTQPGTYAVNITSAATQGTLVGSTAAGLTITAGVNDQFTVTVDGIGATVTLPPGTYTAATLAAQVQSTINGASALIAGDAQVVVTESAGVLTATSKRYGSTSSVSVSGSAATTLFGASPGAANGVDVAGTINGVTASGSGQRLTGAAGTAVDGLVLEVAGTSTGSRGTVTFSRGYAYKLDQLIDAYLAGDGALASRTDGINRSIQDIARTRETLSRRLEGVEARLRAQFSALDTLISSMTSTSNFLTQQLAALDKLNR
jgi:flagellar hook-associated protein 2